MDRPDRKTVHIVVENGCVIGAYAGCDVDVVVYDLDCPDDEQRKMIEDAIAELESDQVQEVEIY
jgi:hypothetical protein